MKAEKSEITVEKMIKIQKIIENNAENKASSKIIIIDNISV